MFQLWHLSHIYFVIIFGHIVRPPLILILLGRDSTEVRNSSCQASRALTTKFLWKLAVINKAFCNVCSFTVVTLLEYFEVK